MNLCSPGASRHRKWAAFRLSVVGPLLASPPQPGELKDYCRKLASKTWNHPLTDAPIKFSVSTIERWYYVAKNSDNPIDNLATKLRADRGGHMLEKSKLAEVLQSQYRDHPSWTRTLHLKNLQVLCAKNQDLGPMPSYSTLTRYMVHKGMVRLKKKKSCSRQSSREARHQFQQKETRTYEVAAPGSLWHLDGHTCKTLEVLDESGSWISPVAIGTIDDNSRTVCHLQWYSIENSQYISHSVRQALQKRGLPWKIMSDNGTAMKCSEFTEGLTRLSIQHNFTLPYTPEQNAKLERFWGTVESQLIAMLENKKGLTLTELNDATQAWVELGYNRQFHEEIRCSPIDRFCGSNNLHRPCPDGEQLKIALTRQVTRKPRNFDATVSIEGIRFSIPWQYRHINKLYLRYAAWDLSIAWLMDETGDNVITRILPLNRLANATGNRRVVDPESQINPSINPSNKIAPLLQSMMEEYAATGMPPTWLPTNKENNNE